MCRLDDYDPTEYQNSEAIDKCVRNALALAIAKRAQQNKCQSDPEQLANNVNLLVKLLESTSDALVQGYLNAVKGALYGLVKNAILLKCGKGDLIDRILKILRATSTDGAKQVTESIGNALYKIFTLN